MTTPVKWAVFVLGLVVVVVEVVFIVDGLRSVEPFAGGGRGGGGIGDRRGPEVLTVQPATDLPRVGASVETRVTARGDLEVSHWIRTRVPLEQIRVAAFPAPGLPEVPTAAAVLVAGDGKVVSRHDEVGAAGRVYRFAQPVRLVYLSYRLTGAVDPAGSVTGRALLRVTALDVDYRPRAGPTRVTVLGPVVRNLACFAREELPVLAAPCGMPRNDGWQVLLRGAAASDRVIAQVDLG